MGRILLVGVIALGLISLPAAASTQEAGSSRWTPDRVAAAIEAQAGATSFAQLEAFGRDALRQPAHERFKRLDHVAWVILNQADFTRFEQWNGLLAREAGRAHNRRFGMVARINGLDEQFQKGNAAISRELALIADGDPDWYVRSRAMVIQSIILVSNVRTGEALRRLADADALTPDRDPMRNTAQSRIWEIRGVALMALHDLDGAAVAFGRYQFDLGDPRYPHPDIDSLYNMAELASRLGEPDLAERLAAIHHRLAVRSNFAALNVWDKNLCAHVALMQSAKSVVACTAGLNLLNAKSSARFLAPQLLTARIIALSRLGRVKEAARDLAAVIQLRNTKAFPANAFERLPQAQAALLHAQKQDEKAYLRLLSYLNEHDIESNRRFSSGVGQLTGQMQKQLGIRREQLATAQRNAALEHDVIAAQRLLTISASLLAAVVALLLVWQWRVAGQLRRARAAADAANRSKSDFLANMSHEIRTPLNGVVAVADLLSRADLPPKEQEMAEIIRASGDTLQRLLSDILDMARIESGMITLEHAPFHAGAMIRAVAGLSQLKCDEMNVRLVVEIAPEIDQMVIGDLVRVRQVVTNLLSNAVKFTEKGEVRLLACRTDEGWARFSVIDTGVGFAMADKAKVLGRFQQADSSITRRFGGTGLGLSICCNLAELMGGVLDCSSQPGVGSTFWMELPLERAGATPEAEAPAALAGNDENPPLRILVADDHPTNRKVMELMLAGGVAELTMAEDGAQALAAFRDHFFDLVLMDMQMPVMDGLTSIAEIRKLETVSGQPRTPVVMLTANALPEHIDRAMQAGADLHLAKPFTAAALFQVIERATDAPYSIREQRVVTAR